MTKKPSLWADLLLTLWVVGVGVVYFGGYFLPSVIGIWTGKAAVFYALMLLISIAAAILNLLRGAHEARPNTNG